MIQERGSPAPGPCMDSPTPTPARARPIPTVLTLVFLATEAVLLVNAAAFVVGARRAVDRAEHVARQADVLAELQTVRTRLFEAESAARGYALTGDPAFLGAYRASSEDLPRALERAAARVQPTDAQRADLATVRARVADKLDAMRIVAERRQARTLSDASAALAGSAGPGLTPQIDAALATIEARETAAVEAERERAGRTAALTVAAALGATLLAMAVIAIFYRRMGRYLREQQRAALELRQTNESLNLLVAERTAELTHLSQHLISVAEEEKAAFARELHDALGSNLTAVDIDVKWVEKKLREREPELSERLRRALGVLEQSVEIKRNVIEALRPSLLDMLGLATALESLCDEFTRRSGIDCVPDLDQELPDLPPDVSIALYRVVQEALANVQKYAQASVVRVALHREAEHLHLTIEDDGIGIPDDALTRPASHGLVGMRERLRVLGGTFTIRRGVHGRGTLIDAVAPRPV
jgi:signal transduction histidine kinase